VTEGLDEPDLPESELCAKRLKIEQQDLLLDYRAAVTVAQTTDTRHEFDKYLSLPSAEQTANCTAVLDKEQEIASKNGQNSQAVAGNTSNHHKTIIVAQAME